MPIETPAAPAGPTAGVDVHNYVAWRDAFDPHLTGLLAEVWT